MFKVTSIKNFLLMSIIGLIIVSGTITLVINYEETQEQVEELFDAELAQMARVLQSILVNQLKGTTLATIQEALVFQDFNAADELEHLEKGHEEYTDLGHKYEKKLAFQVWHEDGRQLIHTKSAEGYQFTRMPAGFHELSGHESHWRTFTLFDPHLKIWIQVAQRADVRSELTGEIALHSLFPSSALILLLIFGISWVVSRALAPLQGMSTELGERSADNLANLTENRYPKELQILVDAINRLFTKLRNAMERERRFTADAAHELRTPLAATKVHLENALVAIGQFRQQEQAGKSGDVICDIKNQDIANKNIESKDIESKDIESRDTESKPPENKKAKTNKMQAMATDSVTKAMTGLQRLIHMVEQLLQLSRLDQEHHHLEKQPTCLNELVEDEIDALSGYAAGKGVAIVFEQSPSKAVAGDIAETGTEAKQSLMEHSIMGNPGMLQILLRNLLDNAVRYSPKDSTVKVRLEPGRLVIEDQGPGIPAELREQIFERFYRGKSTRESGSGLGLSIVQQIAHLHGMTIELGDAENHPSGLRVTVTF